MTDAVDAAASNGQPTVEQAALASDPAAVPGPQAAFVSAQPPIADERPELVVGAAFAGGLALALFLKRLAR
ncbi:MAG: hypothetical protein ACJ76L_06245 [Conexibacter sp.]